MVRGYKVDTDRDRDIALLEVQEENRKLVEEYYRMLLGKRGKQNGEQEVGGLEDNEPGSAPSG